LQNIAADSSPPNNPKFNKNEKMNTQAATLKTLKNFIGEAQLRTMFQLSVNGEEREFFTDKMIELESTIQTMPKTYETDGQGRAAKITLHYFKGGCDWWIVERDMEQEQHQAFGLVSLGYEPELGYISLPEILKAGAELDLHWTPTTVGEILEKQSAFAA
jgi:hypothetical protein